MPYSGTEDLPEAVKQHLTVHARHIYLKAFNNAYGEYARPSEGRDPSQSRDQVAHMAACSAVKEDYEKNGNGQWIRRRDADFTKKAA